ncbi:MAG: hypothetical protein MR430_08225 [Lachnospiraceae bacterium]|nr:hypothetical protein [Lachnospiraceae bacterium]
MTLGIGKLTAAGYLRLPCHMVQQADENGNSIFSFGRIQKCNLPPDKARKKRSAILSGVPDMPIGVDNIPAARPIIQTYFQLTKIPTRIIIAAIMNQYVN